MADPALFSDIKSYADGPGSENSKQKCIVEPSHPDIAGFDNANRYKSFGLLVNNIKAAIVMNGEKTKKTSNAPFKVFDMPTPPKIFIVIARATTSIDDPATTCQSDRPHNLPQ